MMHHIGNTKHENRANRRKAFCLREKEKAIAPVSPGGRVKARNSAWLAVGEAKQGFEVIESYIKSHPGGFGGLERIAHETAKDKLSRAKSAARLAATVN